jgi:hypothetical protein
VLFIAAFLFLSHVARSQVSPLPDLPALAKQLAVGRMLYSLGYTFADARFPPKRPSEAASILKKEIDNPSARDPKTEIDFLKQHESNIDRVLYALPKASHEEDSNYMCDDFLTPVRIAQTDSGLCVVFTGLVSNATYDSYSHTARMRAATVMQTLLLPCVKALGTFAADSSLRSVGVAVYYSTSANDSALDVPEMLLIVSPKEECIKFSEDRITEDELLDRSDVFLADVDTPFDVRKIKLELQ